MRAITGAISIAALLACGSMFGGSKSSAPGPDRAAVAAVPSECPCSKQEHSVIELVKQVEECAARTRAASLVEPEVRIRHVPGAPKRCAGEPPQIAPVKTSSCAPGMVCMDADAQRTLILNLATYEAFVRQVQSCEGEGP